MAARAGAWLDLVKGHRGGGAERLHVVPGEAGGEFPELALDDGLEFGGGGERPYVQEDFVETRLGGELPFGAGTHVGVGLDGEDFAAEIQKQPRENAGAGADI